MSNRCGEHFEKISQYLDGELDADTCREIERHLAECGRCGNCLESLRRTVAWCKGLGKEKIPAGTAQRLRRKILDCLAEEGLGRTP